MALEKISCGGFYLSDLFSIEKDVDGRPILELSDYVMVNGDKEIILASSTAGSNKQFKISVDDSGTLKAEEYIS